MAAVANIGRSGAPNHHAIEADVRLDRTAILRCKLTVVSCVATSAGADAFRAGALIVAVYVVAV